MADTVKLGKKGLIIHSQARELIANVMKFMKEEAANGDPIIPLSNYKQRVLAATGISESSYKRILKEAESVDTGASTSFSSPRKNRPKTVLKTNLPNHEVAILRRTIHNFYIHEKKRPTLKQILEKVRECEIPFTGSTFTLNVLLKKIGFRWKKTTDNRKALMESYNIRALRTKYLRNLTRFRNEGRSIVYTDETYIHSSHTVPKEWCDGFNDTLKAPISKGRRFIIVHAGNEHGFIPNALLMFKSGSKSGDYHDEMNYQNYKLWLNTQLIPNLPENCVLVMDNASYHNVKAVKDPTTASLKGEMCDWLTAKNVVFDEKMTKPELYEIIKMHKTTNPTFTIDVMLAERGVSVLRLPPYHPELNPIEKVWALVKNWVARHNVTFKMEDVETLTREKFANVSQEEWRSICDHVKKVEEEYIQKEHVFDECSELVFRVNTGDSSDSDSDINYTDDDV